MKHKSTTNYQHFLEDLAGMYPFSIDEAVLSEIIANCLDAKASKIIININEKERIFEICDNGKGMNENEFENYHNFSVTFKEKGKGIGFAGLGSKLSLKIADKIMTETYSCNNKNASLWEFKGKEPEWDDIPPSIINKHGTIVRIFLKDKESLLLNSEKVKSLTLKHYQPLLMFDLFYRSSDVYPEGVKFIINSEDLDIPKFEVLHDSHWMFLTKGRKKKPFGICQFFLGKYPFPEELQGIGISCYGKIINIDHKEFFKQQPKNPDQVFGIIEVPDLVDCIITSKTAFKKDGYFGTKYYGFNKIAQQNFINWLEIIGQRETKKEETQDVRLMEEIIKLVGKIICDIPELHTMFGAKQIRETLTSTAPSNDTAAATEDLLPITKDTTLNDAVSVVAEKPPEPTNGNTFTSPGDIPVIKRPRSIKFGPSISLVDDATKGEISWIEGVEQVIINKGHPAFKSATKTGQEMYHYILSVGFALIRELPSDHDKMMILNKYLTNWGNL